MHTHILTHTYTNTHILTHKHINTHTQTHTHTLFSTCKGKSFLLLCSTQRCSSKQLSAWWVGSILGDTAGFRGTWWAASTQHALMLLWSTWDSWPVSGALSGWHSQALVPRIDAGIWTWLQQVQLRGRAPDCRHDWNHPHVRDFLTYTLWLGFPGASLLSSMVVYYWCFNKYSLPEDQRAKQPY